MKVVVSAYAQLQLELIFTRLSGFSLELAVRTVDQLTGRAWQLERFPDSGRIVPEFGNVYIRELIEGDFRILYERFPDRIEVISILNGRMSLDT